MQGKARLGNSELLLLLRVGDEIPQVSAEKFVSELFRFSLHNHGWSHVTYLYRILTIR